MHVADQLFVEAFEVRIGDERVSPEAVLPDWSLLGRFGIVVTEPLGGLGASLLLQLAIAKFYPVRPDRRASMPVYPEIYLDRNEARRRIADRPPTPLSARASFTPLLTDPTPSSVTTANVARSGPTLRPPKYAGGALTIVAVLLLASADQGAP